MQMVQEVRMNVPDMTCEGCAAGVRRALTNVPGVSDVDIDVENKEVIAHYDADKTTPEALRESVYDAGFSPAFI